MGTYEFSCRQLFNEFGAPGIPNTYRATLYRDGHRITSRDFWFWSRAEKQCARWAALYGAQPTVVTPNGNPEVNA